MTATVRNDGKDGSERVLKRTFWILDSELDNLTVGKFVNISVVEDEEPWFSILQSTDKITFWKFIRQSPAFRSGFPDKKAIIL